jgi:excisionase family DNA binding protein
MLVSEEKEMRKERRQPPPIPSGPLKFLTRREAARELRMSLATLDRAISRGELKAKKHGHSTFVMASEIDRYIAQWPDIKPRAADGAR